MPALEIKSLQNFKLDYSKINPICPKCKRNIELDYNFTNLGWRFVAIGTCPKCNSTNIQGISRVTGYLSLDERFGEGKVAERADRVSHDNLHAHTYNE